MSQIIIKKAAIIECYPHAIRVALDEELGLVKRRDLDWHNPFINIFDHYKKDMMVDVAILGRDKNNELILSVKHSKYDPWPELSARYNEYKEHKEPMVAIGTIQEITNNMVFLILENYNTAILSSDELELLSDITKTSISKLFSVGDFVKGIILNLDESQRRVEFSINTYLNYLYEKSKGDLSSTKLGDIFGDKFEIFRKKLKILEGLTSPEGEIESSLDGQININNPQEHYVLVIEDDPQEVANMRQFFLSHEIKNKIIEFTLTAPHNIEQEMENIDSYSCIIIDKNLGEKNGVDLIKRILRHRSDSPIILITGEHRLRGREILSQAGLENKIYLVVRPQPWPELGTALNWSQEKMATREELLRLRALDSTIVHPKTDVLERAQIQKRLQEICTGKQRKGLVLHLDPVTLEMELDFSANLQDTHWEPYKTTMRHTPIFNILHDQKMEFFCPIPERRKKHLPEEIKNAVSMIGIPFTSWNKEKYGIVVVDMVAALTFRECQHFMGLAHEMEFLVARWRFREEILDHLRFTTMGILYSAMRHEILGLITGLSGFNLEREWDQLSPLWSQAGSEVEAYKTSFRRKLTTVNRACREMRRLFDFYDMLDRGAEEKTDLDIKSVIKEVAAEIKLTKDAIGIDIAFNDETGGHLLPIMTSKTRLKQILRNVLLNACQQINESILPLRSINLRLYHDQADAVRPVKILVQDSGPGIHRRDFEKIFSLLYTTRKGGMGLGLNIAREFLLAMGGSIRVFNSFILVGTEILIELPGGGHAEN